MSYRLLKHKDYEQSARRLPPTIQNKAVWAQVLLGMRGRTPSVKGTTGANARWRRTPVQGNHYYMWWIPRSESYIADRLPETSETNTILIHSIRHHDETDDPLDPGSPDDYEEVAVAALDPRYEEQHELSQRVNNELLALATVKGLPGSGKTISLFYLVRDLAQRTDIQSILYVTYTNQLKRAAHEFLQAQPPAISQAVSVCTLSELEHKLTGLPAQSEPFSELRSFLKQIELQPAGSLGPWKKYPQTLYTELRAHLLGKTFPASYTLPQGRLRETLLRPGAISASAYARDREVALPLAEQLIQLADRLNSGPFFQDQRAAQRGLEVLQRGRYPSWLANLDALIVDEVQDLTLLQIAFLGELVRTRLHRRPEAPFVFTVAGDESQIVQPSGFDWGSTKDLLGEQLDIWPEEFEFLYQRRAPRNLAQLIDNSWRFYGHLPKAQRPSAKRQAFVYPDDAELPDGDENGRILLCTLPVANPTQPAFAQSWQTLLAELADKPGRVLIDLTETLRPTLAQTSTPVDDEVILLPREIKGLERATVLIHGLNPVYERAMRLCNEVEGGNLPKFEARRLFDEMRVALSRSTEKIILLEAPQAPVLTALGIDRAVGVGVIDWPLLLETLQNEAMSELEMIEGYLEEAQTRFDKALWTDGYRYNRRAYELARQIGDLALQREAQEQYVRGHLAEAGNLLQQNQWQAAHTRNRQAQQLAEELGDPELLFDVEDQFDEIGQIISAQVQEQLAQVTTQQERQQFKAAQQSLQAAQALLPLLPAAAPIHNQVEETFVALAWQWAAHLVAGPDSPADARQAAALLRQAGALMLRQEDKLGAEVAQLIAERYEQLPQRSNLGLAQIDTLLNAVARYLDLIKALPLEEEAYLYAQRWLDEAFVSLGQHTTLYYRWAVIAQEFALLTDHPGLDEQFWDLENRFKLLLEQGKRALDDPDLAKFQAFIAGYNGDPLTAAQTWEQLGELKLAVEYAREAGDLERSYRLFHQLRSETPEEVATTVKFLRLAQQLKYKHANLRPAERQALLAELAALQEAVASVAVGEEEQGCDP